MYYSNVFPNGNLVAEACVPKNFSKFVDQFINDNLANVESKTQSKFDFRPRVDVSETESQYILHVSVPGIEKENISVEVEENKLVISGERKKTETQEGVKYHVTESLFGKFKRSFSLPKNADVDSINATANNGILEITINKKEEVKTTKSVKIS